MNLTDIYRTFHQNTKEYTFFLALHGTFSKINYIQDNKEKPQQIQKKKNKPMYLIGSP